MKALLRARSAIGLTGMCGGLVCFTATGQIPPTAASGGDAAEVVFRASAPQSMTPKYTFHVHADGSGSFEAAPAGESGGEREASTPAAPVAFVLSARTTALIFGDIQVLRHNGFVCGAKMKGVADMGTKWVEYRAADGAGSCSFNYTQNRAASDLAEVFGRIALTLDEGRKLAFLHKYDRLGLNDEMTTLYSAAQSGQGTELGTIAPILRSLVRDTEILERVRVKAASLLKMAGVTE
jgi:hypothetical protein